MIVLTVIVAPSVALASWWNPFSWKIFSHKKDVVPQTNQVVVDQIITTSPIEKKNKNTKQETSNIPIIKEKEPAPTPVTDVCNNIGGIQTTVPAGWYLSESNICKIISHDNQTNIPIAEIPAPLISPGLTKFTNKDNISYAYFIIDNTSDKLLEINGINFNLVSNDLRVSGYDLALISTEGKENSSFIPLGSYHNSEYSYNFDYPVFVKSNSSVNLFVAFKSLSGTLEFNKTYVEATITKIKSNTPTEFKYLPVSSKAIYVHQ